MNTRRQFLAATAGGFCVFVAQASTRSTSRYAELEARIARRDLKHLFKEDLPTPCMVVDLGTFEKNLNTMADHCRKAGLQLRGHVKVHKSPEIARRQAALGSIGVTCATVAECELMANAGIKGVLLG